MTIVLGGLGAAIGFAAGGPAGAWKGWQIGAAVGGIIDELSMQRQEVGKLSDLRVQGSAYGAAIPRVWGNVRVPGMLIWVAEDATGNHLKKKTKSGGGGCGGGGKGPSQVSYSATYAVAFAQTTHYYRDPSDPLGGSLVQRPVTLKRLWADDMIIWEEGATDPKLSPDIFTWHDGTDTQAPDSDIVAKMGLSSSQVNAFRGLAYIVISDHDLSEFGNRVPSLSAEIETDEVTLADLFADQAGAVGITSGQLDLAAASGQVIRGAYEPTRNAPANMLAPVCQFYGFDVTEQDGKVGLKPVTSSPVLEVPKDDMNASTGGDPVRLRKTRALLGDLPGKVEVQYFDTALNGQAGTQAATIPSANVYNVETAQLPLTLTADEALQGAYRRLEHRWNALERYDFSLPPRYMGLAVGDVIQIPDRDLLRRVKLTQVGLGPLAEIRVEAVADAPGATTQDGTGDSGSGGGGTVATVVPSIWKAWSGLEVRNEDQESPGFYVAANGGTGWAGGTVYYSTDGGTSWIQGPDIDLPTIWGVTTSALSSSGAVAGSWDTVNSFGVNIAATGGTLVNATDSGVRDGGQNQALVGGEILGFGIASLTAPNQYTLSRLLRGERNSPMTGHVSGEDFIILSPALARVQVSESLVGQVVKVAVVSPGQTMADVTPTDVTIAARTATPAETILASIVFPNFVTPTTVATVTQTSTGGAASATWATFDATSLVPATARAIILEAEAHISSPDGSTGVDLFAKIRKDSLGDAHTILRARASGNGDNVAVFNRGEYPLEATTLAREFDYLLDIPANFVGSVTIRVVGYWG